MKQEEAKKLQHWVVQYSQRKEEEVRNFLATIEELKAQNIAQASEHREKMTSMKIHYENSRPPKIEEVQRGQYSIYSIIETHEELEEDTDLQDTSHQKVMKPGQLLDQFTPNRENSLTNRLAAYEMHNDQLQRDLEQMKAQFENAQHQAKHALDKSFRADEELIHVKRELKCRALAYEQLNLELEREKAKKVKGVEQIEPFQKEGSM